MALKKKQTEIAQKEFEIKDLGSQISQAEISMQSLKNALSRNLRKLNEAEAINSFEIIFSFTFFISVMDLDDYEA